MRKIDWYILKNFLSTFFFSLILLTLISTVIDISEHTDDFARSNLSAGEIFYGYYIGFIPHIVAMLFPLFVFISVIFFTSKMANRSEFIAILSSGGQSFKNIKALLDWGYFFSPDALVWECLYHSKGKCHSNFI